MTYDEWKLETPEDEAHRKARFWNPVVYRCCDCGTLNQDDKECRNCGCTDLDEEPLERDPDDARDAEMDR